MSGFPRVNQSERQEIDPVAMFSNNSVQRNKSVSPFIRQGLIPLAAACLVSASCIVTAAAQSDGPIESESAADSADLRQATEDIDLLKSRYSAPSVSVAIIQNGEIIYAEAMGLQDVDSGVAATTSTQYGIGSIVKSFTSGLVGSMLGDELLDLSDAPVSLIEGLTFGSRDLDKHLRLFHLLTQTSGLPFMDGSLAFFPEENQADLASRLPHFDASCRVGDCWAYNNLNFIMLDMILESVGGKSKSELLNERLLGPGELNDTLSSTSAFEASPNAATGYGMVGGGPQPAAVEYLYDEHIYTTASDLARWLDVWMSDGGGLLPPDYVQAAISTHAIEDGAAPTADEPGIYLFGYGYGWQTKSMEGNYVVHHGGNENGFSAHVIFVPARRTGFVTLTNQQNSILPNIINDMLLRRMLELQAPPVTSYPVIVNEVAALIQHSDARPALQESPAIDRAIQDLRGVYSAEGYGAVEVELRDQVLVLTTPASDFILRHQEGNRFGLASTRPVPLGIVMDFFEVEFAPGTLTMNIAAQPVVFTRDH